MLEELDPSTILYTHFGLRTDVKDALEESLQILTEWVENVHEKRVEYDGDRYPALRRTAGLDEVWDEQKAYPEVWMNTRGVLHYLDLR